MNPASTLRIDFSTYSKQDVVSPLLRLMQQWTDQRSLSGEVEGNGMAEPGPGFPRDQGQGESQSLKMSTPDKAM